jgi:hypothetical protein
LAARPAEADEQDRFLDEAIALTSDCDHFLFEFAPRHRLQA